MPFTVDHLREGLAVKRGEKRLKDIKDPEFRKQVAETIFVVRDAEWSELASERELSTRPPRSARFTWRPNRAARS